MVFPPELFDNIIDHLHDDKQALLQCATVCRGWLNSARYHLFYTIDFAIPDPKPRLLALTDFVKSNTRVAACIRVLRVQPTFGPASNPLEMHVLAAVARALPNLRAINLSQMKLDHARYSSANETTEEPQVASRSVQSLSIRTVLQTHSMANILEDLCLFPSLKNLELSFISWRPDSEGETSRLATPTPLELETLTVGLMTDPSQLFRYIQNTPSVHTLTTLCLFGLRIPDVPSAGLLLQDLGRTLQHFSLSMEHFQSPVGWDGMFVIPVEDRIYSPFLDDFLPSLNLARCTALKSFYLLVPHYSRLNPSPFIQGTSLPGWWYADELLSHVSTTIQTITLVARLEYPNGSLLTLIEEWDNMDWEGMSESFRWLPGLQRVNFLQQDVVPLRVSDVVPLCVDLQEVVLRKLPLLSDLGVLHFQQD